MHSKVGKINGFLRFIQDEEGFSFIECALVTCLIAVVVGLALLALGVGKNGWL